MTTTGPGAPPRPRAAERVAAVLGSRAADVLDALVPDRRRSLGLEHSSLAVGDVTVHLLGAGDGSEAAVQAAVRGADAVVLALPAAGGPDAATARLWGQCASAGTARAVVVTAFDEPHADFDEAVALAQRVLGEDVAPLQLPMHGDDDAVDGVLDLLRLRVSDSSSGTAVTRDPDPQHRELVAGLRADLLEELLADSHDETLLHRYLDGEPLDPAAVDRELRSAVQGGRVAPVLAVQGAVGADGLRALLAAVLPSPLDVDPPAATRPDGTPVAPLSRELDGPLAADVLAPDGDGWLVRVRSGRLQSGAVLVTGHGHPPREDDVASAGGVLCTVAGLHRAATGDTVSSPTDPLLLEPWPLPDPLHAVAVPGADPAALDRLARRDPTLRVERRGDQLLLWCLHGHHARSALASLGVDGAEAPLGDDDVPLEVDVLPSSLRPVLRALARHGGQDVDEREHEERELVTVHARVAEHVLPALTDALRTASSGSARTRRG